MFENWTKDEYVLAFRSMWEWIANETEKWKKPIEKKDYLREFYPGCAGVIDSDCFLCEYTRQFKLSCDNCPVCWGNDEEYARCAEKGVPYAVWNLAVWHEDWREAARAAREIANLPEK